MSGRYADLSSFNPENINWQQYVAWSAQDDGIARVALRVSQGVGVPDTLFPAHYANAKAAGVGEFIFYHFAYPWLHPGIAGAQAEADYFLSQLPTLGPNDLLMLDAESYQGQSGPGSWYYDWLQHAINGAMKHTVTIYANPAYIASNLQDTRLAAFPLILADWTFNPASRPPAPAPWSGYLALQYTDRGVAGGIPETVDLDLFLGGGPVSQVPTGPFVTRTFGGEIPATVSWQALAAGFGLSDSDFLAIPGNEVFAPYDSNPASVQGMKVNLPGYDPKPAPTPPPVPEPVVPSIQSYTVAADDTSIQEIAQKLHLGSWFSELYQPNMDEIETAARAAGHPNSDYGSTVVAGTVLHYRA